MNQQLHSILSTIHQESIIEALNEDQQSVLLSDLLMFNSTYPGGIQSYIDRTLEYLSPKRMMSSPYVSIEVLFF